VCLMGLSEAELTALASEGVLITERNTMLTGYKTYLVSGAMMLVAAAMLMGISIPEEIWMMLGAIGLGTLRAAVEGVKEEVK
jgi:hypothetical protein